MTSNQLRQAMARAFAEEVERYAICEDNGRAYWRSGGHPLSPKEANAQLWINERGIAAAMRVAAEHIGQCNKIIGGCLDYEPSPEAHLECAFNLLGKST